MAMTGSSLVQELDKSQIPSSLCQKYRVHELIKRGATGYLYRGSVQGKHWLVDRPCSGKHDSDTWIELVLKLEEVGASKQQMNNEWHVYRALLTSLSQSAKTCSTPVGGFLDVQFDQHVSNSITSLNVLATKAEGKDLNDLLSNTRNGKFSLKTILSLGEQMVELLSQLHFAGFAHRDIKPENFVVGGTDETSHLLYLIDFGVARKVSEFSDLPTNDSASQTAKRMVGSVRYLSTNAHKGVTTDGIDDLESVAYVLFYLFRGSLPWQGLPTPKDAKGSHDAHELKLANIAKVKSDPQVLASLHAECPAVYDYLLQVKQLQVAREGNHGKLIDYNQLKSIFGEWRRKRGIVNDNLFEWNRSSKQATNLFINMSLASSTATEAATSGVSREGLEAGVSQGLDSLYDDLPAEKTKEEIPSEENTKENQPKIIESTFSLKETVVPSSSPERRGEDIAVHSHEKPSLITESHVSNGLTASPLLPPFEPPPLHCQPLKPALNKRKAEDVAGSESSKKRVSWKEGKGEDVAVTEYVLKNLGPASVWGMATDGSASPASQEVIELNESELLQKWSSKLNHNGKAGKLKNDKAQEETSTVQSSVNSSDSNAVVVKALTKILPNLKTDKCSKALKLFAQLVTIHTTASTIDIIVDALACSVANARRVHQATIRDGFADLFHQASLHLSLCPPLTRHQVALWAIAADIFNTTTPLQHASTQGRIPDEAEKQAILAKEVKWRDAYQASIQRLHMLLEHMLDCFSSGISALHPQQKADNIEGDALSAVPVTLYKARLFDVLVHRYAESYKESWLGSASKSLILSCFERTLKIPLSWWPSPHGRSHRTQIERTFSTLQARR